jgi:hypothetical protein
MHAYFATLAAGVTGNDKTLTAALLGGLFGLDGIHPTNTCYALLANQFIAALNTKFGSSIAAVNVAMVAAADPYIRSGQRTGTVCVFQPLPRSDRMRYRPRGGGAIAVSVAML